MPTPLIELVEKLPNSKIVLIGDLMIDRYVYGNAERLSPEAPVPVLHYQREEFRLGGAGNVAANLAAMRARTCVVGVVGNDEEGRRLCSLLAKNCRAEDLAILTRTFFFMPSQRIQARTLDIELAKPGTLMTDGTIENLKDRLARLERLEAADVDKNLRAVK